MLDQIYQYNLIFPKDLLENIYKLKNESNLRLRSNILGWQSKQYSDIKEVPWIAKFLKDCCLTANIDNTPTAFWFNVNPKHAHHRWHSHGGASTIGIFYIQIPENSGNIEFKQKHNTIVTSITPYEGLLLIAPAGIEHRVLANNSDADRISMAFNFDT
jgi:hypothetical protein